MPLTNAQRQRRLRQRRSQPASLLSDQELLNERDRAYDRYIECHREEWQRRIRPCPPQGFVTIRHGTLASPSTAT